MSGRQAKVINEQADRYGIPFGGRVVDLSEVVKSLHNFLANNARRRGGNPGADGEDDPLLSGSGSPALERYREERAQLARLDRMEREKSLVPREEIRSALAEIAGILRTAGEVLQQSYGNAASEILNDALDDAEAAIEGLGGVDTE